MIDVRFALKHGYTKLLAFSLVVAVNKKKENWRIYKGGKAGTGHYLRPPTLHPYKTETNTMHPVQQIYGRRVIRAVGGINARVYRRKKRKLKRVH